MHQAAQIARVQGNLPGAIQETLDNAHRSTLDWRSLLRRYLTDAASADYSWSVPNRRYIDSGLYLPSIRSEGIAELAVIIDTSASLPSHILDEFWAEIREIATDIRPETLILLQVDAVLQDATEYAATDLPDSITLTGRGGTTSARASNGWNNTAVIPAAASTSPTWSATAIPSKSRSSLSSGAITARSRTSAAPSRGGSASTCTPSDGPPPAHPPTPRKLQCTSRTSTSP